MENRIKLNDTIEIDLVNKEIKVGNGVLKYSKPVEDYLNRKIIKGEFMTSPYMISVIMERVMKSGNNYLGKMINTITLDDLMFPSVFNISCIYNFRVTDDLNNKEIKVVIFPYTIIVNIESFEVKVWNDFNNQPYKFKNSNIEKIAETVILLYLLSDNNLKWLHKNDKVTELFINNLQTDARQLQNSLFSTLRDLEKDINSMKEEHNKTLSIGDYNININGRLIYANYRIYKLEEDSEFSLYPLIKQENQSKKYELKRLIENEGFVKAVRGNLEVIEEGRKVDMYAQFLDALKDKNYPMNKAILLDRCLITFDSQLSKGLITYLDNMDNVITLEFDKILVDKLYNYYDTYEYTEVKDIIEEYIKSTKDEIYITVLNRNSNNIPRDFSLDFKVLDQKALKIKNRKLFILKKKQNILEENIKSLNWS